MRVGKDRLVRAAEVLGGGGEVPGAPSAPRFFSPRVQSLAKGRGRVAEQVSEVSVLFADVSGSTKLYETAGDAVAHAAIEKCVNLMREKTLSSKGRVIKTIGDEVMSAFQTADDAAGAAIEMQAAISEMPPVGTTQIG